ncbi:hypothetical protein [Fulvivirga lutea]|uniref:General stress protein CsbD n=1 Tax=Fulvivirga lutea TaxID=2810512 RepID=A0A974WDZ1_9BACT|nr:hypothetical protein [Fulvivirga lutea]QSE96448.1 hypothetical protein JR347_12650 [Fulvivirga lutea]
MDILRSWREQKAMLKMRFPTLSDTDFDFKEGEKEGMLNNLSSKLNKTRNELCLIFA